MLDWLLEPFSGAIMQRALVEVAVIGLACGPMGVWILLHRQSYAAESIAHAMLPGLVIAALIGMPLVAGGAAGLVVAAALISLAGRDQRLGADVGVAVAITFLFGLGALLALSPDIPPRLPELLFGDPLGVGWGDVAVAGALAAGVLAVIALGYRGLVLSAFDVTAAPSLGVRPGRWSLGLLVLLALCTLAAVQGLGNLLVVALILAPAAAALEMTERLPGALLLSALLAVASGVLGLLASFHWQVAAGAAIALTAVTLFLVVLLLSGPRAHPGAAAG